MWKTKKQARVKNVSTAVNRGTGLLVINVVNSNPNGDPDGESEPRTFETDSRGLISPVSFKRKLRDLMFNPDDSSVEKRESDPSEASDVRRGALAALGASSGNHTYDILETRGRKRGDIEAMKAEPFKAKYWDARIFGNTFLESVKDKDGKSKADRGHFITTGVVQIGPGVSVAPVDIVRLTLTNKSGVQEGKNSGMAPLAFRVVRHGLYTMPFFVNPSAAYKSGCDAHDIDVLKFLIPHAYAHTASGIRPEVHIVHAWYAEHRNPLGSCPDPLILTALKPKRKPNFEPEKASLSIDEYDVPTSLPDDLQTRLGSFEDLCLKDWPSDLAA
jgi:CRISPR-associated protein Csd2